MSQGIREIPLYEIFSLINPKQKIELREIKGYDFTKAKTIFCGTLSEGDYYLLRRLEHRPVRGLTSLVDVMWIYIDIKDI